MYALRCPNCGRKVAVPRGAHTVVETQTLGGKHVGITIDGKPVHRCDRDQRPRPANLPQARL
jgi:hypothetical protein